MLPGRDAGKSGSGDDRVRYRPVELLASPSDWQDMRQNPGRRKTFDPYAGLEVRLALVRHPEYDPKKLISIGSSNDVYKLVGAEAEPVESMLVLILDSKHRVVGVYVAVRGQVDSVGVTPADILRAVLVAGQNRFILVHNHPSGDPVASTADRSLTERVARAAGALGCTMLDHIIVGFEGHFSFAANGILPETTGSGPSTVSRGRA